jgi:hypothetical protein
MTRRDLSAYCNISAQPDGTVTVAWTETPGNAPRSVSAADIEVVDRLVDAVGEAESAHRGVEAARRSLGRKLFELIDGPARALERRLQRARDEDAELSLAIRLVARDVVAADDASPRHPAMGWRWELLADARRYIALESRGMLWESPAGYRVHAPEGGELLQPMDRLVLLFLLAYARRDDVPNRVHARHDDVVHRIPFATISEWCGRPWRTSETRERLRRLLSCMIERRAADGWRLYRVAAWWQTDEDGLRIQFAPEFLRSSHEGGEFPVEHLHAFGQKMAVLELYLFLRWILHKGRYCERWDPYRLLRSYGVYATFCSKLRKRLARVNATWRENPFRDEERYITCSPAAFKLHAFGIDEEAEKRAILATVGSMSRLEVRAYMETLPEEERRKVLALYLQECMVPAAMEQARRVSESTPARPDLAATMNVLTEATEGLQGVGEALQRMDGAASVEIVEQNNETAPARRVEGASGDVRVKADSVVSGIGVTARAAVEQGQRDKVGDESRVGPTPPKRKQPPRSERVRGQRAAGSSGG